MVALGTLLFIAWILGVLTGLAIGKCIWAVDSPKCAVPKVPEVFATIALDGRPFSPANRHRASSLGDIGASTCMGRTRQRSMALLN